MIMLWSRRHESLFGTVDDDNLFLFYAKSRSSIILVTVTVTWLLSFPTLDPRGCRRLITNVHQRPSSYIVVE